MPKGMLKRCIQPAAIAYIGGYLRSVGIKVELLGCIIEGWSHEELVDENNSIYTYGMSDDDMACLLYWNLSQILLVYHLSFLRI